MAREQVSDNLRTNKFPKTVANRKRIPTIVDCAWFLSYLAAASVPALVATFAGTELSSRGTLDYLVAISGIFAYTTVVLQFVLAARIDWIEKLFGVQRLFRTHKTMAVVATLSAVLHLCILLIVRGEWTLLLYAAASWPIQLGRIAGASLVLTLVYSLGRRWIPINNSDWRFFHSVLAWIVLLFGFMHSILIGVSFASPLFAVIWTVYFAVAILAWLNKWNSARRTKENGARPASR